MRQQRAIEIHDEKPDWERWFHSHTALPAPTNFGHAVATRKIAANGYAPTDAKAIGESCNVVTLTIAEFKECNATGAQQSWQLSDESANQLQPITAAIKRKAWLCSNAEARQVAWRKITNACGLLRLINVRSWYIRQVGNQEIEMCRVAGRSRRKEWLGEITVHEGDARCNAAAQRIRARHHQRLARDVGGNKAQRHWRLVSECDGECAAPSADLGGIEWMRCATKCAVGRHAVGEKGECRLNDQFALWSRVKHVWCNEEF
jgi:hypothetical protein